GGGGVGGKGHAGGRGGVAQAAVGDDAGYAALPQPRDQYPAGGGRRRVAAAVDHEDMAGRTFFHALALRMAAVFEHAEVIEVFPCRNVAQRVGRTDHAGPPGLRRWMPWMKVLRKPRLKRTVVRVAVDTAINFSRLLALSDMVPPFGDPLFPGGRLRPPAGLSILAVSTCIRAPSLVSRFRKFARHCGTLSCELRNLRDTSKLITLVWFLDLKFLCEARCKIVGTSNPPH